MEIIKNPNFDFLGKTRIFVTISVLLIVAGLLNISQWPPFLEGMTTGIRYGVEFSGGTQMIIKFRSQPEIEKVRDAVSSVAPGAVIQSYDQPAKNQVLIRLAGETGIAGSAAPVLDALKSGYAENGVASHVVEGGTTDAGQLVLTFTAKPDLAKVREVVTHVTPGAVVDPFGDASKNQVAVRGAIEGPSKALLDALTAKYSENPWVPNEYSTEIVGPVVGAELRRRAVTLTALGLLFQLVYIAIRFRGAIWGAAATIAVLHDVLVTLGFLSFFHYEITLNVIAALLTLVGYSVNDTIVIFDRARENIRQRRKDPLVKILNDSVNQTLTRTLISNGTTFLAMLGLFLFGGEVLRGFGFTMVVGIVVGTYSTIYIASPVVAWWQSFKAKGQPAAKAAL